MDMSVASRSSFCLCVPDDAYQARGEESVRDATVQLQERDENDPGWPWKNTDDATASLRRVPELQVGSSSPTSAVRTKDGVVVGARHAGGILFVVIDSDGLIGCSPCTLCPAC